MSAGYQAIGWGRQKRLYDMILAGVVVTYLGVFAGVSVLVYPTATAETVVIRAFGTAAFLLLHVILAIGPAARLDRRWLPLLYNRRHLGVTMFGLALVHGLFSLIQFHAAGVLSPLVSVLVSDGSWQMVSAPPFHVLGLLALGILFLMAATSHDFWLNQLSAPVWKALHMAVYGAYGLLVAHVAFGAGQMEGGLWVLGATGGGAAVLITLHLLAASREQVVDVVTKEPTPVTWHPVCGVDEIADGRARIVSAAGERIAVFRHGDRFSAVSNACQHQNGPLGEGRIIDGCITCPWHGYQYLPESGASPAPFTEKICTFRLRIQDGRILLDPRPLPPGTSVPPALRL